MLLPKIPQIVSCRLILAVMLTTCYIINGILLFNFFIGIVEIMQKFQWDLSRQSYLLSAYYIGAILTKVPTGTLSDIIGPKIVIGACTMMASILTILTPIMSSWDFSALVVCRMLVGVTLGACISPFLPLLSRWVPSKDNSKYATCLQAITIGGAIANPLGGYLINSFGWKSSFYVTGGIGCVWVLFWFILVYDTPSKHPRITHEELEKIQKELETEDEKVDIRFNDVPWKHILKSVPLWALVFNFTCLNLSSSTVTSQLAIYFNSVHQLPIHLVGFFTSMPYIGSYIGALIFGYSGDFLRQKTKLSTTVVRKIFISISMLVPAGLLLFQTFYGDILWLALVAFTAAFTISGTICAGQIPNGLDLAPNFSGVVFGIINMFGAIPGCFSPSIVALLVDNPNDVQQWRNVHFLLFGINVLGCIVYLLFGSGKLQKWNNIKSVSKKVSS